MSSKAPLTVIVLYLTAILALGYCVLKKVVDENDSSSVKSSVNEFNKALDEDR